MSERSKLMPVFKVMERPFPPFKEWIQQQSPGTQADGFEAMTDLAYRSQAQINPELSEDEASYARMWIGACIACVELCNMEALSHRREPHEIVLTLPRVLATAAMYAIASVAKDETPFREIAKLITEEFRFAAKIAADALEDESASDAAAQGAK